MLAISVLLVLLALAPIDAESAVSAVDGRGKRIELPAAPRRIVSIAPSITEILFALGLSGRIVADTSQCDYPPEARKLPHIGDYRTSVEQVVAQRPDLVIAVTSANHTAIDRLEQLHVPVFAVDPHTLPDTYEAILKIGQITESRPEALRIVKQMQARVETVKRSVGVGPRPRVMIVVQAMPLMVAAAENFMDEVVTLAGGDNIAREAGPGFRAYSPERVVIKKPDIILAGRQDVEIIRTRAGWSDVPAVRNGKIFSAPPDIFGRAGPRLPEALEAIAKIFRDAGNSPSARKT